MPDESNKLYLYEALEMRSEYDARIKTLKACLPETREEQDKPYYLRDEEVIYRPSSDFNAAEAREQLRTLEFKRRKLNGAIQRANFEHTLTFQNEAMNLNDALELRKSQVERMGELNKQVVESTQQRVI